MGWGAEVERRRSLNELGTPGTMAPAASRDGMRRSEKVEVPEEA
jgi:hypothetical protein